MNIGSYEPLTDWTDSKTEADIWCQECEEHETQPECRVVSREIDEYTVSVDDSRFLAQRERVGGLSVWAIVEWRDDMPYATATTIQSVGVSDEAPRARDTEHALSEIEAIAYRERRAAEEA